MLAIIIELGWPIWPLILASVLALALIIERSIALRREKILPAALLTEVISSWNKRQMSPKAIADLEQNGGVGAEHGWREEGAGGRRICSFFVLPFFVLLAF